MFRWSTQRYEGIVGSEFLISTLDEGKSSRLVLRPHYPEEEGRPVRMFGGEKNLVPLSEIEP